MNNHSGVTDLGVLAAAVPMERPRVPPEHIPGLQVRTDAPREDGVPHRDPKVRDPNPLFVPEPALELAGQRLELEMGFRHYHVPTRGLGCSDEVHEALDVLQVKAGRRPRRRWRRGRR
jgi:hypothetical protein